MRTPVISSPMFTNGITQVNNGSQIRKDDHNSFQIILVTSESRASDGVLRLNLSISVCENVPPQSNRNKSNMFTQALKSRFQRIPHFSLLGQRRIPQGSITFTSVIRLR